MPTSVEHCAALVREADRDRYLAALFAPAERRDALFALYAFNIEISRVRDVAREPMPGEIRLQWWREVLSGERDGEAAAHPVAAALVAALMQHNIAPERLSAIIDAHTFDLYDDPLPTLDDFDNYAVMTQSALIDVAADLLGADRSETMMLVRG
ncbi:MAG: squalene/phytoene synthase family protein, partial [Pseudolabrys sp.]|nr:squalene/phytoene synthase family protein [Pseudolabrys sp.]